MPLLETPLPDILYRGKVRDTFDLGDGLLLMVATDRISAFDVVLPNGIPDKGRVLSRMSRFWFEMTQHVVPNHFIALADDRAGPGRARRSPDAPGPARGDRAAGDGGQAGGAHRCRVRRPCLPHRIGAGRLQRNGHDLRRPGGPRPGGRQANCRICCSRRRPRRRSATTSPSAWRNWAAWWGGELAEKLRALSFAVFRHAHDVAAERGIIIADTKFEFGIRDGENHPDRRGAHAGFEPVLGRRGLRPRQIAAQLRQAVRPRLVAHAAGLGPDAPRPPPSPTRSSRRPASGTGKPTGRLTGQPLA